MGTPKRSETYRALERMLLQTVDERSRLKKTRKTRSVVSAMLKLSATAAGVAAIAYAIKSHPESAKAFKQIVDSTVALVPDRSKAWFVRSVEKLRNRVPGLTKWLPTEKMTPAPGPPRRTWKNAAVNTGRSAGRYLYRGGSATIGAVGGAGKAAGRKVGDVVGGAARYVGRAGYETADAVVAMFATAAADAAVVSTNYMSRVLKQMWKKKCVPIIPVGPWSFGCAYMLYKGENPFRIYVPDPETANGWIVSKVGNIPKELLDKVQSMSIRIEG